MVGSSGLRFEAFKVSDGSPYCFLRQFRVSKDVSKKWPSQSMPPTSITQEGDICLYHSFWEEHFDQAVHFKTALLMVEIWKNQSPGSRATLLLHTSLLPLDAVAPTSSFLRVPFGGAAGLLPRLNQAAMDFRRTTVWWKKSRVHQLRWVLFPIIFRVLYGSQVVV